MLSVFCPEPTLPRLLPKIAIVFVVPATACDDVSVVFPEGGDSLDIAAGGVDVGDEEREPSPENPLRGSSLTINGDAEGLQLGGGALLALPPTTTRPARLLLGGYGDSTNGTASGSLAVHTVGEENTVGYSDAETLMVGAAGTSFGCGGRALHSHAMVAIGACTRSAEAGEQMGAVYLFSYDTLEAGGVSWEQADGRIEGAVEFGGLGRAIASGDFDGDGAVDIIVGAPDADGGRGRIYVHADVSSAPWQSALDLSPLVRGTAGDDALGRSLLMDGDLTGDGYSDLIVCAPGWDVAGVPGAGACGVIAGGLADSEDARLEDQVVSTIYGSRFGDSLGDGTQAVAVGHFLDTDRFTSDAPRSIAVGMPGSDGEAGAVLVVGPSDLDGYVSATAATLRINGDGRFGHSLAALPGGGLLVGAPEFAEGGAAFAIVPDRIWMPSGEAIHASNVADGIWIGANPNGRFGTRVATGHDIDNDRWPDVLIGAPGPTSASPGSVTVGSLPDGWSID
ncbi:MAG: hypothetical protein CL927_18795 [Deltaproteobacteria bacterium]|nr:hypothetical protein [Deltaproteobacteria bacterium]HCH62742.1 hypothetical protein [Deltaproteobacteria bacterium]